MYPVSDAFIGAINSNNRRYTWSGVLITKTGARHPFEAKDIVKGSGSLTRECCGSTEIELGSVYAAELQITLLLDVDRYSLDGGSVELYFTLALGGGGKETIPMGVFDIQEANRSIKCLEIKAYDHMIRFEKDLKIESSSGTAYNFIKVCCDHCGVELGQTQTEIKSLPNGNLTLGIYEDNDISTYRDLLFYCAQVLGSFCQIDRTGKLVLKQYGTTPVATIPTTQRYTSTYSDFVTKFTAISSTNIARQISEYYALDPDNALTLNLGINPLMQFGLPKTREKALKEILNAIAVVDYVPFESETIGNPAFDPGDILRFTGGHADSNKISCITSLTYQINGKHKLKCVGKNPKLAEAKSKNDKNIEGLLNQVEAGKVVIYDFMNATPFDLTNVYKDVMDIDFTSKEETTAAFHCEMLIETTSTEETGFSTLYVQYRMNRSPVSDFIPVQTCVNGPHIVTLFYPITGVIANSSNTFSMYLKVEGGTAHIGETQIRATLSGYGLVAGLGDWNGLIDLEDSLGRITFGSDFSYRTIGDDTVTVKTKQESRKPYTDDIGRISLDSGFSYKKLDPKLTMMEIVKTFTMNKEFPGTFNPGIIELNEDGSYRLINGFAYVSEAGEIDHGGLQVLEIDKALFDSVESEVLTCDS